jgi:multidrug resistance efflux pump
MTQEEINELQGQLKKARNSVALGRIIMIVLFLIAASSCVFGYMQYLEAEGQYDRVEEANRKALMYAQETEKIRNQAIDAAHEMARTLDECAKLTNKSK